MFLLNGKPLALDVPFETPDGTQYPANWLRLASPEDRKAIGITEVPDPPSPWYDQRFYWGPGLPKDHGQLVTQWVDQTRYTANTLLSPTDWMIVRSVDNGKAADPAVKTWRENIRSSSGLKISAIKATKTTEELAAFVTSPEYSAWPALGEDPAPTEPPSTGTKSTGIDTIAFNSGTTSAGIG
jgi:hypothetical protein